MTTSQPVDHDRARACVSACTGIPDPAAAIQAAREAMEADVKWYDGLIAMHRMVGDNSLADACVRTHGQRIDKLRHALSLLTPNKAV